MAKAGDFGALNWVKDELDETVRQARSALEDYVEHPEDGAYIATCIERMHQVQGILHMLQLYGPGMLAEEIELVAVALRDGVVKQQADGAEALMLALIQFPDYLEKLQSGKPDIPLIILPLLNDLRAVRDAPLLSEAALFSPQIEGNTVPGRTDGEANPELPDLARRIRHRYHLGLLNWYRDKDDQQGFTLLSGVLEELEQNAGSEAAHRLFWIARAVVEGLKEGSVGSGVAIKLLLGKVDREIKHLIDGGEDAVATGSARDLLKNLLYYIAQCKSETPLLTTVKSVYHLHKALPSEEELALGRQSLSTLNADLLESVKTAITNELTSVKDTLDLYIRSDRSQIDNLLNIQQPMGKVADTLGMVGQGALRARLMRQVERIAGLQDSDQQLDDNDLMEMAGDILFVESSVSSLSEISPAPSDKTESAAALGHALPPGEYDALVKKAVHEAKVDIAKAKEAIVSFVATPREPAVLSEVPGYFQNVCGALRIMLLDDAAAILGETSAFIKMALLDKGVQLKQHSLNALAEVISSIEYYLESLAEGVGDRDAILRIARQALSDAVEGSEDAILQDSQAVALEQEPGPSIAELTDVVEADEAGELPQIIDETIPVIETGVESIAEPPVPSADKPALEDIDPEILEIFVEEAREELESLEIMLPRWKSNPDDCDALTTFRRSFHTLKGSGRLVGAKTIGELAWSIENMLNRLIDETIRATPEVIALLDEVVEILPHLIDCQERQEAPSVDTMSYIERATALSEGREPSVANISTDEEAVRLEFDESAEIGDLDDALSIQEDVHVEHQVDPASFDHELQEIDTDSELKLDEEEPDSYYDRDSELMEVFESETRLHLTTLEDFVANGEEVSGEVKITDEVVRACHTLRGSARTAGVHAMARLGETLEQYVNALQERNLVVGLGGLALIAEGVKVNGGLLNALLSPEMSAPKVVPVIDRINAEIERIGALSESASDSGAEPALQIGEAVDGEAPAAEAEDLSVEVEDLIETREEIAEAETGEPSYVELTDDDDLIEIFLEEAQELTESLSDTLRQWQEEGIGSKICDDLKRTLHTLKGSSRLAGALPIGDLSHAMESLLLALDEQQVAQDDQIMALFQLGLDRLQEQAEEAGRTGRITHADDLIEKLQGYAADSQQHPSDEMIEPIELLDDEEAEALSIDELAIDSEFSFEDESGLLALSEEIEESLTEEPPQPEFVVEAELEYEEASTLPLSQEIGLLEEGPGPAVAEELSVAAEPELIDERSGFPATEEILLDEPVQKTEPAQIVPEPALDAVELGDDEELIEIFLEEAHELNEALDRTLQKWCGDQGGSEEIDALQRSLHTLKGSARLAGAEPVGDLSHALESLLTAVVENKIDAGKEIRALVQQGFDRLAAQVDEADNSRRITPAVDLLARLYEAADKGLQPAAEAEPVAGEAEMLSDESAPASELKMDSELLAGSELLSESELLSGSELLTESELLHESELFVESEMLSESVTGLPEETEFPATGEVAEGPVSRFTSRFGSEEEKRTTRKTSRDKVRIKAELLDRMVNQAGEVSIYRSRIEQQNTSLRYNLHELESTVVRLREQLRKLDMETEAQILFRHERDHEDWEAADDRSDFDPLEMDRFSTMQQLSRSLMETVSDLSNIGEILEQQQKETDTLLLQQSRVSNDLQDALLHTRMVPLSQVVPRFSRVVRQTSEQLNKKADLVVEGAEGQIDRGVLDRMVPALEHLLRNAISHGIEEAETRAAQGKSRTGKITLRLYREGTNVVLNLSDDGAGLNLDAIRNKALSLGLLDEDADTTDDDLIQLVLGTGFSTASEVTQIAGRGIGLDVVSSEVKQLGGVLDVSSKPGKGTRFTIHLPLTLAITDALLIQMGEHIYAVPHGGIEGVVRVNREDLEGYYKSGEEPYVYAGNDYKVDYLGHLLGSGSPHLAEGVRWFPLLLVHVGEHRVALQVDGLLGTRQVVVKSVGSQLASLRWITGGTILSDGRVALIMDISALVRTVSTHAPVVLDKGEKERAITVMVVDDSITVRKVTGRLLERHNMQVLTAKDGVDAVAVLQDHHPDLMLLDIEMPRMDGFELARHMRNSHEWNDIPIIMISSRVGEKHRKTAFDLGVKRCLGKPYQENDLMENIYALLEVKSS